MALRFNGLLVAILVFALPACNRNSAPVAKTPDSVPKADPPGQNALGKPKQVEPKAPDPLIEKAKALPPGKVRIELIRSAPAGAAGERAEYEWALLTQFPSRADKPPKDGKNEFFELKRPTWVVVRMTMKAVIERSLDKASDDRQFINLFLSSSSIWDGGNSTSGGQLRTTKNLSLDFSSSSPIPVLLSGQFAVGDEGKQHALTIKKVPLDDLVIPLAKEPTTSDLPRTLELARFGDEIVSVALSAVETK